MCAAPVAAQSTAPAIAPNAAAATAQDASRDATTAASESGIVNAGLLVLPFAQAPSQQTAPADVKTPSQPAPPSEPQQGFQWGDAFKQYMMLLMGQHLYRLPQEWTHSELGGPFWADYVESVASLRGWNDGDTFATNYIAHPVMGAVTGYIQIQNDPAGRCVQFGKSQAYWRSRAWALAAAAIYSIAVRTGADQRSVDWQRRPEGRPMAYVDLVITPLVGVGMIIAEDAIDRYLIAKVEGRMGRVQAALLRSILNPNRSLANLIRIQAPWKRDARGLPPGRTKGVAMPEAPGPGGAVSTR